jgi:pimeloyl-ACP methyl ester carboxylesterase
MMRVSSVGHASTLIVFLPGRGGSMQDFVRNNFLAILHEAGVTADSITVDAHLGYYYKRTVVERLWTDVLQPARQQGYRRIVLVGISLGGVGALLCEREHPGAVDALVLLSPYLGDNDPFFKQIADAGGPARWAAGRDLYSSGVEEQLWTFLGKRSANLPPTWLLFGRRDSLAQGHRLLATLLPAARVSTIDGAHDWPTWRALWHGVCFDSDLFLAEKGSGATPRTPEQNQQNSPTREND